MPGSETTAPILLASGSPTRKAMLERAGLTVEAVAPSVDEAEVKHALRADGASAEDCAELLAEMKAKRVAARHPGRVIVAADQMLVCNDIWFDKPPDRDHARAQLVALSDKTHTLISAVVVFINGARTWHHVDRARLTMRRLSPGFIDGYLDACGEAVLGSVGAYQLEGRGAQLFASVEGDFFSILGLPLLPLLDYLRARGVVPT